MRRENLEGVIEGFLDRIADAKRASLSVRGRYRVLDGTGYSSSRNQLFMRDGTAERLMKSSMFQAIRTALAGADDWRGQTVLTERDLAKLDQAWAHYQLDTVTAAGKVHKRWYQLAHAHNLEPSRLATPNLIFRALYPILYEPMLRGDEVTFNKNNDAFLSAFKAEHKDKNPALPVKSKQRLLLWQWYLSIAAFCHHRLNQQQQKRACLVQLRNAIRETKCHVAMTELLAHYYYEDRASTAALRALRLVMDRGIPEECSQWSGFAAGRAMHSAVFKGADFKNSSPMLGGLSPHDALLFCVDELGQTGQFIPYNIFKTDLALGDAMNGNLDHVYDQVDTVDAAVKREFGTAPHLSSVGFELKALAHLKASNNRDVFHLKLARQNMQASLKFTRGRHDAWSRRVWSRVGLEFPRQAA